MVQDVQVMGYMPSMPESVAPRRIEHEKSDSSYFFHDVILGMLMILLPVMLLVFLNGINIQEEYRMQRIRSEVMTMAKENAVDKLEVSRLEAPVRIQQIAEQKLKMSLPVRAVYGSADPAKPHPNQGR
mgnify:CR=1 FL=1